MDALHPFSPARFSYLKIQRDGQAGRPQKEKAKFESPSLLHKAEKTIIDDCGSFSLFPKLPLELQRRIWHFAALTPRIVEIHEVQLFAWIIEAAGSESIKQLHPRRAKISHFRSKTADPPLLQACRESRDEALRITYRREALANEYCADSVYFELERDTMYMSRETLGVWRSEWLNPRRLHEHDPNWTTVRKVLGTKVRSVAFDANVLLRESDNATPEMRGMASCPWACKIMAADLYEFRSLEEIILVLDEDHPVTSDSKISAIRFHEPDLGADITALLQVAAHHLSRELEQQVRLMERQAAWREGRIHQNYGGIRFPTYQPASPRRTIPLVRTMVTKLR